MACVAEERHCSAECCVHRLKVDMRFLILLTVPHLVGVLSTWLHVPAPTYVGVVLNKDFIREW